MSSLQHQASVAEGEAMVAQGSMKTTSRRMQAALALTAALRGETARWSARADELEVQALLSAGLFQHVCIMAMSATRCSSSLMAP